MTTEATEPETESEVEWTEDELELFATLFEDEQFLSLEGLSLAIEEPPVKPGRAPAVDRKTPWEQYLAFLKTKPGVTVRLFEFAGDDGRDQSRKRARVVRNRLIKTQPEDQYEIVAVEIPDDKVWRIYATYEGAAGAEEVAKRKQIAEDAINRGKNVAAACVAAKATAKAPAKR